MKRYILILTVLLSCLATRAQSVTYTCRYWFDQNFAQATTATFSESTWQAELDVGALAEGLHTLHFQIADTSLKWNAPESYLFLKTTDIQQENLVYHYWFDHNHAQMQNNALGDGQLLLEVSDLNEGLHELHLMLKGSDYSTTESYLFLNMAPIDSTYSNLTFHSWFDQDFANRQNCPFGSGHFLLNVNDLDEGLHTLNVMLESSTYSATESYMFMRVATFQGDTLDMSHLVYHCWFDQDFEHQQTDSIGDGHFLLDVADLADGLHTVNVFLESNGTVTASKTYMFMKVAVDDPSAELQYHCWFDGDYGTVQMGLVGGGFFEVDVADLSNGIHTVNLQFDNGMRTAPLSYLFYKIPLGGYGIARWEYWLNDDIDNRQTTNLVPSLDTLDIITLLPVETWPIRSSCFHFHPNGDAPYLNAKNQITFRFWDTETRFFDKSAFYVDEQVQQEIVAQVFDRNTTETFATPRDNQIQWFKLDVSFGDSLAFVADKACTMQLFAPSGEEAYSATASQAMVWGGCYAWEDGTYYLAVHDVTGSGETVSVIYQHFDKYVILACSPDKVGNRLGNRFMMDLVGNGFNYLENAMLIRENDTMLLNQVIVSSRTKPKLQFVVSDVIANGNYDLYLTFRDGEETETLCYAQAVELEEPDLGEKIVTITTPAQTANPYPVRITVENTGNLDYVYVPFNIAFTWPTNSYVPEEEWIDQIDFVDFCALMTHEADSVGYSFGHVTTNLLGTGKDGGIMFFGIPYLQAHETRSFTLNFTAPAHIRFDLYAWVGDGYEYNLDFDTLVYHENRADPRAQNMLDLGDVAEEVGGLLGDIGEYIGGAANQFGGVANAAGQVGNNTIKTGVALAGIYNAMGHIQDKAVLEACGIGPGDPMYDDIMNLHPPIATPGEIIGGWGGEMLDRIMGFQRTCGDIPTPNPGTPCHVFLCHPGDPNDMHGYTSESGSHYMRQEIQTVQYEIEFENDTTLATAAAHTIIVRDTLDATKFDLNSLAARSVTIGDKRLELNGEQTFARTLDLRPELYVIAQINQDYDPTTGIIQWTIQSLDPMTMEPTDDPNQGVLPVNYYGNGVGFIDYSVNLLEPFADGTAISNRAGIIFDQEEVIMTPTWTNIIDAVKPVSYIEEVTFEDDTLNFNFVSSDNRSGVWYHTLYYRNDSTEMEWQVKKAQIIGNDFTLKPDLMTTEFLVMAVDSAGNHEEKDMVAEYVYFYDGPEPVCQSDILVQGWNWWSTYLDITLADLKTALVEALPGTTINIKSQTQNVKYQNGRWAGQLTTLDLTRMYMISVENDCEISLVGMPINLSGLTATIISGANWLAFPYSESISVSDFFGSFPMNNDLVKSQSQNAKYQNNRWGGQLNTLVPGKGYIYISNSPGTRTFTFPTSTK